MFFSEKQTKQWNLLFSRFIPLQVDDESAHVCNNDIKTILRYCLVNNVKLATFLTAAEFWRRIARCKRQYDVDTMLACIVGLAAEVHEVDLITAEDLSECAQHFYATCDKKPNVCMLSDENYTQCLCFLMRKLHGTCYTQTLFIDFLQCAFCNAPPCMMRLTTKDIDDDDDDDDDEKHCHDDSEKCIANCWYERIKLWCEFATLFDYTRADYVVLFASQLCNEQAEYLCGGCYLKLVHGDIDYCTKMMSYGQRILTHLVSVYNYFPLFKTRYALPNEWRNVGFLFRPSCAQCFTFETDTLQHQSDAAAPIKLETQLPPPNKDGSKIQFEQNDCQVDQLQLLDKGTYGKVFRVCNQVSNEPACVKLFIGNGFAREIGIALRLNHTNILSLLRCGYNTRYEQVWSMTPFLDCGDLQHLLLAQRLTKSACYSIMLGLTQALYYMHRNSFVHFDVKPSNVLCTRDGSTVKLFDFSISHKTQNNFTPKQYGYSASMIGSICYRAPELLKAKPDAAVYVFAADAWSLGMVFYRLLDNEHLPLVGDDEKSRNNVLQRIFDLQACNIMANTLESYQLPERLVKNQIRWNQIVQNSSVNAADLLDSLLNLRPETRISTKTALRHPYLCQHILL